MKAEVDLFFMSFFGDPTVKERKRLEWFRPLIRAGILHKSATGLPLGLAVSNLHEQGDKNPARPFLTQPHTEYKLQSVIINTVFPLD